MTYNATTDSKTVDPLKRNQFGGTVGGPLEIPHVFHSNKAFGFFGYQKTIDHEAATSAVHLSAYDCPGGRKLVGRGAGHEQPGVYRLRHRSADAFGDSYLHHHLPGRPIEHVEFDRTQPCDGRTFSIMFRR